MQARPAHPDLLVHAPFEVWLDVVTGRLPGMQAFMGGQCRAEGDFGLLMQLDRWFGALGALTTCIDVEETHHERNDDRAHPGPRP